MKSEQTEKKKMQNAPARTHSTSALQLSSEHTKPLILTFAHNQRRQHLISDFLTLLMMLFMCCFFFAYALYALLVACVTLHGHS